MSHLFYDTFGLENTPYVFLCGDESLEILRGTLARELSGQGKTSLLFSDAPMSFPVEGQILVDIKPELLKRKIDSDSGGIFSLCSEVKDDLLMPVDPDLFREFFTALPGNTFVIGAVQRTFLPLIEKIVSDGQFIFINVYGFGALEGHLSKFINEFGEKSHISFEEELKKQWQNWSEQFCPDPTGKSKPFKRILYLNQVKTLIDENQVIPIVRNIADFYDQVFIGDINEYKLKEIR